MYSLPEDVIYAYDDACSMISFKKLLKTEHAQVCLQPIKRLCGTMVLDEFSLHQHNGDTMWATYHRIWLQAIHGKLVYSSL